VAASGGGGTAPVISTQPANQTVTAGGTATFSVTATGTGTLTYQWMKGATTLANGGNISGATSATLTISNAQSADQATYSVTAANASGSVASPGATLTVTTAPVAPTISTQPASQTVATGATATFSVSASGTGTLTYQWKKGTSA